MRLCHHNIRGVVKKAAALFVLQMESFDTGLLSVLVSAELTFHLLFWASGVTGGARHAHVVPVDVLEKHLGVPAGQRARLEHEERMLMSVHSQRSTATTNQESELFNCARVNLMKSF